MQAVSDFDKEYKLCLWPSEVAGSIPASAMDVRPLYMLCRPKQRPCDELGAYPKSRAMCVYDKQCGMEMSCALQQRCITDRLSKKTVVYSSKVSISVL